MDLATLRTEFKKHTSGLADALSDADVDAYLNRFYRWVVPSEVGGDLSEIIWDFTAVTTTSIVPIPEYVVSLTRNKAWIFNTGNPDPLKFYIDYDYDRFINRWPDWNDGTKAGRPDEICVYGRNVYLNRRPDVAYTCGSQCRGGDANPLATDGIPDEIHALTVLTGAAWNYLLEKEDDTGSSREGNQYSTYKSMLNTRSHSRYQRRRGARSYK